MAFPDRIERTIEVAHPPARVWAALTTAEGLGTWFGNAATIDLRPGGSARMTWANGSTVEMRVERVEEPTVFGFTWPIYGLPEDDPRKRRPDIGKARRLLSWEPKIPLEEGLRHTVEYFKGQVSDVLR